MTGTYTAITPTDIEVRRDSGAWSSLSSVTIGGGVWSGTYLAQSAGQGTIAVRCANDHAVTIEIFFGLGDNFIFWGDSTGDNGTGVPQNASSGPCTVWMWNGNHQNFYNLSMNTAAAWWPYLGTDWVYEHNVPVMFVPTAESGNKLMSHWNGTIPGSGFARAAGIFSDTGLNAARFAFGMITANDAFDDHVVAEVTAALDDGADWWAANIPGAPTARVQILGDSTGGNGTPPDCSWGTTYRTRLDMLREGVLACTRMGSGANLTGQLYVNGGNYTHPDTATVGREIGDRFWATEHGSSCPRFQSATINAAGTSALIHVDSDLSDIDSEVAAFLLCDDGEPVTLTEQKVSAVRTIRLTPATPVVGTPTVYFASGRDAVGQTIPMSASITTPDGRSITQPLVPFFAQPVTISEATTRFGPIMAGGSLR